MQWLQEDLFSVSSHGLLKRCADCHTSKPAEAFSVVARRGGGRLNEYCKACRAARAQAWREANREAHRESTRRWRREHPDLARESERSWRRRNPEAFNIIMRNYNAKRRARLKAALVPGHPVDVAEIFKRDGGICHICKKQLTIDAWELDHVIPLAAGVEAGGVHAPWNVAVSCMPCNRRKGHAHPEHLVLEAELVD